MQHQSHKLHKKGYLSVAQVAEKLGVEKHWVYDRIHNDRIKMGKHPAANAYLFSDKYETIKLLKQLRDGCLYQLDFRKEYQDA